MISEPRKQSSIRRGRSQMDGIGLVLRAARFAARKHRDQRRKGSNREPYINHPLDVAHVLCFEGNIRDPQILAAALLHDTIEDTQTSLGELTGEFGEQVARTVMEATDERTLDWRVRKKLQISRAKTASAAARRVKIADKICNLRSLLAGPPSDWSIERQRAYFDWAYAVVDPMRGTDAALEARFDEVYRQRP